MNAKERVLTTFAHQEADRVPINYMSNPGIDGRLKEYFGLKADDSDGLLKMLNVDFRTLHVPYIGKKLHNDIPERGVTADDFGIRRIWVENESGGYWDFCDFPLQNATMEDVNN